MLFQPQHASDKFGLLRADASDAGRLVSLGDIVRWLVQTRELPPQLAVERLIEVIEGAAELTLYECHPLQYASRIEATTKVLSDWDEFDLSIEGGSVTGTPAVIVLLRDMWVHRAARAAAGALVQGAGLNELPCARFAMLTGDAVRLFGYLTDVAVLNATPPRQAVGTAKRWDAAACAALRSEHEALKRAGNAKPTMTLAKRYGVSDTVIRNKLRATTPAAPSVDISQASVFHFAKSCKKAGGL